MADPKSNIEPVADERGYGHGEQRKPIVVEARSQPSMRKFQWLPFDRQRLIANLSLHGIP